MGADTGDSSYARDPAAEFKAALRGVASTVVIVTANDAERHHGMTATAFMSLSMQPPSLVVAINQSTLLHDILVSAKYFCVNILNDDQEPISNIFSDPKTVSDRFLHGAWSYNEHGVGFLTDAQASIFCMKAGAIPFGTHSLFIGMVEGVQTEGTVSPLLYHNTSYCMSLPRSARS
jgi:flavin reductase (DIM6/NTAB) family NADH-FMN oxidoreductase RutF